VCGGDGGRLAAAQVGQLCLRVKSLGRSPISGDGGISSEQTGKGFVLSCLVGTEANIRDRVSSGDFRFE
jgi:hypothetical protein